MLLTKPSLTLSTPTPIDKNGRRWTFLSFILPKEFISVVAKEWMPNWTSGVEFLSSTGLIISTLKSFVRITLLATKLQAIEATHSKEWTSPNRRQFWKYKVPNQGWYKKRSNLQTWRKKRISSQIRMIDILNTKTPFLSSIRLNRKCQLLSITELKIFL